MNHDVATLLVAFAASFAGTVVAGPYLIAYLKRASLRQNAYSLAPESHGKKSGTPTMGGLLFVIPLACALAFNWGSPATVAIVILALCCGAIGAVDDVAKIQGKRTRGNTGLRGPVKFGLTAVAALAFLLLLGAWDAVNVQVYVPFMRFFSGTATVAFPMWAWMALAVLVVLATTHAVNLTDGLDGLAAGSIVPPLLAFVAIDLLDGRFSGAAVALAVAGSALGFLVFNRFPARVFMGDTGALLLGGALAGVSIVEGAQLILPIAGIVFVAEALSVIVQVTSFKMTRKRVLRMSPLHHHFELGGWPETKVTGRFWAVSAIASIVGVLSVAGRNS
jgi:phospho-N-acetylmuramoyl-pentapeptide-transferase